MWFIIFKPNSKILAKTVKGLAKAKIGEKGTLYRYGYGGWDYNAQFQWVPESKETISIAGLLELDKSLKENN